MKQLDIGNRVLSFPFLLHFLLFPSSRTSFSISVSIFLCTWSFSSFACFLFINVLLCLFCNLRSLASCPIQLYAFFTVLCSFKKNRFFPECSITNWFSHRSLGILFRPTVSFLLMAPSLMQAPPQLFRTAPPAQSHLMKMTWLCPTRCNQTVWEEMLYQSPISSFELPIKLIACFREQLEARCLIV